MKHLTQLTDKSRSFILRVSPNKLACLALAKAIANQLPLPTFEVANKNIHYLEKCSSASKDMISEVNELCVFNTRQIEELVKELWITRYSCAYPTKIVTGSYAPALSFLGAHASMSRENEQLVLSAPVDIINLLNGFTLLLEELKSLSQGA